MNIRFLSCVLVLLTVPASSAVAQTGTTVPGLEIFDTKIQSLLVKWRVPGGSLAIAKDGRLVLARGYGLADVEAGDPVQPDSLFRIASVSKTITGVALMKQLEAGALDLDRRALDIVCDLLPPRGQLADERMRNVTVRQLLQHYGGWDDHNMDTLTYQQIPAAAASYFAVPPPATSRLTLRYVLSNLPLQFDPGTTYAYSNLGYGVLGRVIEELGGQRYEDFAQAQVLKPAGVTGMHIGGNFPAQRFHAK